MARKFQFRLEQVLSLKKRVEDDRAKELAQAKGKLLEIEEALRAHTKSEGAFLDMFQDFEKENGSFNSDQVMAYCDYRDWLLSREKGFRHREREWSEEVDRRRERAVRASRARRLLDNLKEKQNRTHAQVERVEEQKFLDEISSIAFVRRDRAKSGSFADEA